MANLISVIYSVATKSFELKKTIPEAYWSPIEFVCIFSQNEKEYKKYMKQIAYLGKIVEETPSGFTYLIDKPLETINGFISLVKIRKPDPIRKELGDADFNTDFEKLKKKYQNKKGFELIKRDNFEMLRLSDPNFDVMACFSNKPKSEILGIKKCLLLKIKFGSIFKLWLRNQKQYTKK